MKRLLLGLTLPLLAIALLPAVSAAPASAAVATCQDAKRTNRDYVRNCEYDSSRITGRVWGSFTWDYPRKGAEHIVGRVGYAPFKIDDRDDGKCSYVRIKYRDPSNTYPNESKAWKRCDGKKSKVIGVSINQGHVGGLPTGVDRGIFRAEFCVGKRGQCIVLWRQDAADLGPAAD